VLLAGIAQLLFQLGPLKRLGLLLQPRIDFREEGARRVGKLLVPAVFASSVSQINALIDTMLASTLITGSISWLYYSDRLLELPVGLVAVALGTVLLPNLSRLKRAEDDQGFRATLDWGVRMGVLFGLPAAVGLYALALPLISGIFMHGALTEIDALMASLSLKAFAAGLLPLVLVKVLAPAYFAEEDTRSPFRVGVIAVGVNICINLALFRIMGHVGLALGTTCAAWVNAALLARGLVRSRRLEVPRQTVWFALRCLVGVAVMVMVMAWLAPPGGLWLAAGVAERTAWLLGLVAAGGVSYLAAVVLCGIRPAQLLHRA
jgi:putative peptidoglycan lipid II flippase